MTDETPRATADTSSSSETRRAFIERARAAAAIPVIVALTMTWTHAAKAC